MCAWPTFISIMSLVLPVIQGFPSVELFKKKKKS